MERTISALTVICAVFWTLGAVFTGLNLAYPTKGFGSLGIFVTAIAVVTQVQGFFRGLRRREECAYHLGATLGHPRASPVRRI